MRDTNYYTYETALGGIVIVADKKSITHIKRDKDLDMSAFGAREKSSLTDMAACQLGEYFARERKEFDLPLDPGGTDFQKAVWTALREISFGETRTYKQIAEMIGKPKACRAVGMANNKNPIWIVIPCHRVIGADGSLVGYGGGLKMKEKLLNLEGARNTARRL
ncbi:MAG: methylated-DNA--[protein]-cysteine S-methyltransferase [Oscillospiraceae bacterium]|nr:methylated-DNA--[protein]-cysteine S-methyltransferase [Oscillospiraceae bacterium]